MPPKVGRPHGDEEPDDERWYFPSSIWVWRDNDATPPALEVEWEEREAIGELLGPDGETLVWVYEPRPRFGYARPGAMEDDE